MSYFSGRMVSVSSLIKSGMVSGYLGLTVLHSSPQREGLYPGL